MKLLRTLLFLVFCFSITTLTAQKETYTIDGISYTLTTEVEGPLTFLWTTVNGEYRYFIKKGATIQELKNTKIGDSYQGEYRGVLQELTKYTFTSWDAINFTKNSIAEFVDKYNKKVDPNYTSERKSGKLKTRLGAFVGYSNTGYFINPENTFLPTLGIDFELLDQERLRRHAVVFQFEQTFGNSDYDFNKSDFSVNYRFKFIASDKIDVYTNVKFASYIHISRDFSRPTGNTENPIENFKGSGGELRTPGAFGIGADIALGKGFITVNYYDIFSLAQKEIADLPTNIALGYKLNL